MKLNGDEMEPEKKPETFSFILRMDEKDRIELQHKILDEYGITLGKDDPIFALSAINAWYHHKLSDQYIQDSGKIYGDITKDLNVALNSFIEGLGAVLDKESQETIQRLSQMIEQGRLTIDKARTQTAELDNHLQELLTARLTEADDGMKNIIMHQLSAMSQAMSTEAVKQVKSAAAKASKPAGSILAGVLTGMVMTLAVYACLYFLVVQPQQRTEQRIYQAQERALTALPPAMKETYKKLYASEIHKVYAHAVQ